MPCKLPDRASGCRADTDSGVQIAMPVDEAAMYPCCPGHRRDAEVITGSGKATAARRGWGEQAAHQGKGVVASASDSGWVLGDIRPVKCTG
jgi:hypothetical protein